jgi:hypothetical protein
MLKFGADRVFKSTATGEYDDGMSDAVGAPVHADSP